MFWCPALDAFQGRVLGLLSHAKWIETPLRTGTPSFRRLQLFSAVAAAALGSFPNVLVKILGEVRDRYGFALVGYVVMPEHIHLLMSEPPKGTPSTILQVLKQRVRRGTTLESWPQRVPVRLTSLTFIPMSKRHFLMA